MQVVEKDILAVERGIICHQVNPHGMMDEGLALQIRNRWPVVYEKYKARRPRLGEVQLVRVAPGLEVANICSQDGHGHNEAHTNMVAMRVAFCRISAMIPKFIAPDELHFPHGFGCGLSGEDWEEVSALIEQFFPKATICSVEKMGERLRERARRDSQ